MNQEVRKVVNSGNFVSDVGGSFSRLVCSKRLVATIRGSGDEVHKPTDRHGYSFLAEELEAPSFEPSRKSAFVRWPEACFLFQELKRVSRSWKCRRKRKGKTPSRLNTQHRLKGRPSARMVAAKLAEAEAEHRMRDESRLLTIVDGDGRLTLIAV